MNNKEPGYCPIEPFNPDQIVEDKKEIYRKGRVIGSITKDVFERVYNKPLENYQQIDRLGTVGLGIDWVSTPLDLDKVSEMVPFDRSIPSEQGGLQGVFSRIRNRLGI